MKKEENNSKKGNKKVKIVIIIIAILIVIGSIVLIFNKNKHGGSTAFENINSNVHMGTDIYDEIVKALNEHTDVVIYYYDGSTENKINKEIKEYLNKNNIVYYIYDNAEIEEEEYHKVMDILNIDEDVFGMPAVIYMHYGMMYANIINIESVDIVKQFIDDYKLYDVK